MRPWSQTIISEGARPWGRGRSGDCDFAVFQTKVAHLCVCLVRIKMPLLIWAMIWVVQNVWGRKTCQRTRPPEKFWTPPKKLLVCSVVDFVQEKQSNDTRGGLKTYKTPFWEGCHWGAEKSHIKLLHIKLFRVAPVTGPPGRVSGQEDLCCLGSEDST